MRHFVVLFLFFFCVHATAQTNKVKFVGDWKFYLNDKISFEFLRLKSDGTGVKCFGQTINGKDTLFLNHLTALLISNWDVRNGNLTLETTNKVSFKLNPNYRYSFHDSNIVELTGEHLIFYLYPSTLNREKFQRTLSYQKVGSISKDPGIKAEKCLVEDETAFSLQQIDALTKVVTYQGFDNLIPHLISCNNGYELAPKYYDPPYTLEVPGFIHKWSFGFGNKEFYVSFNSDDYETSIIVYYDFDNELKNFFLTQLNIGKVKNDTVILNGLTIYKTQYAEGKFEGRVFYDNQRIVMYSTNDKTMQIQLQKSAVSFKFR